MKTSELTGAALDWAVAKCVGDGVAEFTAAGWRFNPSTNWAQGGPIIEREGITLASPNPIDADWCAMLWGAQAKQSGTTPLIAAMRCYVASKLGDEVEIPKELI
jgi:hypothetical protein